MKRKWIVGVFAVLLLALVIGLGATVVSSSPQTQAEDYQVVGQFGGASYAVALQQGPSTGSEQAQEGAVQSPYLFAGVGPRLLILDVSRPEQPALVGQSEILPGVVRSIALADKLAFVAAGMGGLQVIDVSDPTKPLVIASYDTGGYLEDVAVAGSLVYLASTPKWDGSDWVGDSLQVVDLTDPRQPRQAGSYDTPGYEHGVVAGDNLVFVADGDGGLRVLDVSNPTVIKEVGFCDTPDYALDVTVEGSYAYVAAFNAGLRVVDVSDPANPKEVGWVDTPGTARNVTATDGYAYLADGEHGLRVIDVRQPAHPQEAGFFEIESDMRGVAVANGMAYLADRRSGLMAVDAREPKAPAEVGNYHALGYVSGVAVTGDAESGWVAYLAAGGEVREVDLADLATPKLGQVYDLPGDANDVAVDAPSEADQEAGISMHLYVAEGPTLVNREWVGGGLRVLAIPEQGRLSDMAFIDTPAQASGLTLVGPRLYLADGNGGLQVYDITRPEAATAIGAQAIPGHVSDLAEQNGRLYIATAGQGVSSGQSPDGAGIEVTDRYQTPTFARGLAVFGETLYIADGPDAGDPLLTGNRWPVSGLHAVSVRNAPQLTSLGFVATPGDIRNVAVDGGVVFVADGDGGLLVVRPVE